MLTISAFGVLGTYIQFTIMALVLFGFSKLPNVLNFAVSGLVCHREEASGLLKALTAYRWLAVAAAVLVLGYPPGV